MGAVISDKHVAPRDHMVQLDGVRAFAVLAVLLHHTLPEAVTSRVDLGGYGVRLFFVLSGFLITGILLKARAGGAAQGVRRGTILRAFYARRFLRIFPLYYAVLAIAYLGNAPGIREGIGWYVSYLSNYYFAAAGQFVGKSGSHLWSLAVEEQFYLIWPLLILFLPRRGLPWLMAITVLAGPGSRLIFALWSGNNDLSTRQPTPACLDALGLGALLALFWQQGEMPRWMMRSALLGGTLLLIGFYIMQALNVGRTVQLVVGDTASALVFAWLVERAAAGMRGAGGWLLACWPLVYLGSISYGVYVYQNFIIWCFLPPDRGVRQFVLVLGLTVAVAAASWHFFEKPLNNLKRFFPYVPKK
jgi:peptidoglycan/LPS O-acetylase OafA/YrhL